MKMAVSYLLAPIPKWIIINNQGTTAGGAKLYTKRSLNKVQDKPVYQDAGGTIPYTNPIIFDANGTQGPFYWKVDSASLNDTYFLEAFDSDDNLLWTIDGFAPPGAGGGGNVTTYIPLNNYIANNVFIDHIDGTANPTNTTNLVIAPSNHHGFTPDLVSPIVGTSGVVGPDTRFVKNNTAATDQITFPLFALGSDPLTGDVTPTDYIRYQCTNSPVGETYKSFQFPICQKVNNLDNQAMSFNIWAKVAASAVNLTLYIRQYFGSGGAPSAEVRTAVTTLALTTTWTLFNIPLVIPNTAGKTLGTCGDDALYLQLEMPLGAPCDVWFTKPALYLGTINPTLDFSTYDQIDSVIQTPRTTEIQTSYRNTAKPGWVAMNDGSIGNVGSVATTRANQDCFNLFASIYTTVSNTWAPVSGGRTGTTTADAATDFAAGKVMTLPRSLGRALAGAGTGSGLTARALGEFLGTETHALSIAEMPSHNHTPNNAPQSFVTFQGSATNLQLGAGFIVDTVNLTANTGGGVAHTIMQPTSFMNVFIKL